MTGGANVGPTPSTYSMAYGFESCETVEVPRSKMDQTQRAVGPSAVPFLRWAGSKRQLIPQLSSYWTGQAKRYIEPFVGSACLFFSLRPQSALLGDINDELIETYLEVKYRWEPLSLALKPLRRSKKTYLGLRRTKAPDLRPTERAARFIYLNRFCFNGLYRTNREGRFNVPYGAEGTGSLPSREHLSKCSSALKVAKLRSCDFSRLLEEAKSGDFVYLDPPFSVSERRVFNEYQPEIFSSRDVKRLRTEIELLANRGAQFLLSYVNSDEAEYLQRGFRVRRVNVRRNIAGFVGKRAMSEELLISNFEP